MRSAIPPDSPRSTSIRFRWVAAEHATTTTESKTSSALVSNNSGRSTKSQPLLSRKLSACSNHRARMTGCKIASSFRRCSGPLKTISRSDLRSIISSKPPGSVGAAISGPKTSTTARFTRESVSRSSLATASASKIRAASLWARRRVKLDFPVATPPVIPRTGTATIPITSAAEEEGSPRADRRKPEGREAAMARPLLPFPPPFERDRQPG